MDSMAYKDASTDKKIEVNVITNKKGEKKILHCIRNITSEG